MKQKEVNVITELLNSTITYYEKQLFPATKVKEAPNYKAFCEKRIKMLKKIKAEVTDILWAYID